MDLGNLIGGLGNAAAGEGKGANPGDIVGSLFEQFAGGGASGGGLSLDGLGGLVEQLQKAGLADQVQSWIGTGPNAAISPEQLRGAIGDDKLSGIAKGVGLPIDQLLPMLAGALPQIVNMLTPKGALPKGADEFDPGALLGGLGGLFGNR